MSNGHRSAIEIGQRTKVEFQIMWVTRLAWCPATSMWMTFFYVGPWFGGINNWLMSTTRALSGFVRLLMGELKAHVELLRIKSWIVSAQREGSMRKCVDLLCGDRRLCINHLPGLGRNDLLIIIAERASKKTFSVLSPSVKHLWSFRSLNWKGKLCCSRGRMKQNLLKSHKVDIFSFY